MIYQLPSGRCIEISIEQYLDMTDEELQDLCCLGNQYTTELNNPFHKPYADNKKKTKKVNKVDDKFINEPITYLDTLSDDEKLNDKDFHSDDK